MPTTSPRPRRTSFWPYAIIGWFILFTGAMAAWVVVAVRNDLDLVRPDYYEEEMRHQVHIDRLQRTQAHSAEIEVAYDSARKLINITLPAGHGPAASGSIQLYRPSDARLDRRFDLAVDTVGHQILDVRRLRPGLWKLRLQWKAGGKEYFLDRSVVIAGI